MLPKHSFRRQAIERCHGTFICSSRRWEQHGGTSLGALHVAIFRPLPFLAIACSRLLVLPRLLERRFIKGLISKPAGTRRWQPWQV